MLDFVVSTVTKIKEAPPHCAIPSHGGRGEERKCLPSGLLDGPCKERSAEKEAVTHPHFPGYVTVPYAILFPIHAADCN